jgi:deoxyadenosine/deoxycytidine kinase
MRQPIIITIEGHICAGKTTLLKDIRRYFHYPIVREYYTFKRRRVPYPHFPPTSEPDACAAVDFFISSEIERTQHAILLWENEYRPVFMERSIYSALIFQKYLFYHLTKYYNAYQYCLDQIEVAVKKNLLHLPQAMLHLELLSSRQFVGRIKRRGRVGIGFLNQERTYLKMQDYYRILLESVYVPSNRAGIITSLDRKHKVTAIEADDFALTLSGSVDQYSLLARLQKTI